MLLVGSSNLSGSLCSCARMVLGESGAHALSTCHTTKVGMSGCGFKQRRRSSRVGFQGYVTQYGILLAPLDLGTIGEGVSLAHVRRSFDWADGRTSTSGVFF
mmetsp:Transcript_51371/g.137113  ORF Transcript_51371/g.137113 Transcript_51371/m.137113 type:complete len:102 (-) Transcript_51371:154-459(-)